jgi:hypothetical protein
MRAAARPLLRWLALLATVLPLSAAAPPRPALVLWAWERSEDLRFLAGSGVTVAYVAASIEVTATGVAVHGRRHPLRLAPDTAVLPVLHVDATPTGLARFANRARQAVLDTAARLQARSGGPMQLDFEVAASARPFYRALVQAVAGADPRQLSITALASWCQWDGWLAGLPAGEIVPMLFRMGPDDGQIRRQLAVSGRLRQPECRRAAGLALDEPLPQAPVGARLYLFNPRPWTQADFRRAVAELEAQP